jgi:hypothetical protein
LRCIGISPFVGIQLENPPASRKRGLVPEEVSQTPLTNKKQGKNTNTPLPSFAFTGRNIFISMGNLGSPLKIENQLRRF